jgi:hypothetical protein
VIRLAGALLSEQNDESLVQRHYQSLESITLILATEPNPATPPFDKPGNEQVSTLNPACSTHPTDELNPIHHINRLDYANRRMRTRTSGGVGGAGVSRRVPNFGIGRWTTRQMTATFYACRRLCQFEGVWPARAHFAGPPAPKVIRLRLFGAAFTLPLARR